MNTRDLIPGMCRDANPGQGVQPWSAGDIFPLVIERVEQYGPKVVWAPNPSTEILSQEWALIGTYWNVLNAGDDMTGYASYDEARAGALGWLEAKRQERALKIAAGFLVSLSPFNPAAYDAELAADLVEAERLSQPEPGYGGLFDGGNGSGVV